MSAPKRHGGRPGVGKDGAAGVVVQAIVPREMADQIDEWARASGMKRGAAVRRMMEVALATRLMTCSSCGVKVRDWVGLMCPLCDRTKCGECCRRESI